MAILKCNICGGDIQVTDDTYGVCISCGTTMTLQHAASGTDEDTSKASNDVSASIAPTLESTLKRGWLFLEDSNWQQANTYFDTVLNLDPENASAYLGLLCAELKINREKNLANYKEPFDHKPNYKKALRFADEDYKATLAGYNDGIKERIAENLRLKAEQRQQKIEEYEEQKQNGSYEERIRLKMEHRAEQTEKIREDQEKEKQQDAQKSAEQEQQKEKRRQEILRHVGCISAGEKHTVGLNIDGTVVAVGKNSKTEDYFERQYEPRSILESRESYRRKIERLEDDKDWEGEGEWKKREVRGGQCDTGSWRNIVAVCAAEQHTIGLKTSGTVVTTGDNEKGQCKTGSWRNITAVSAGTWHTVGLKADGRVVTAGDNGEGQCNTGSWHDITAVSAGPWHTVGLKKDGTVVAAGRNHENQCNVSDWTGIVAIAAGYKHSVGLRSDGTVTTAGGIEGKDLNEITAWTDIAAVSAGWYVVGLKSDGTVVATGRNNVSGQAETGSWQDIVAVSAGGSHTIGVRANGTVVAAGINSSGQCHVGGWLDIGPFSKEKAREENAADKIVQKFKPPRITIKTVLVIALIVIVIGCIVSPKFLTGVLELIKSFLK